MPITAIDRYFVGDPNIVGIITTDDFNDITSDDYFFTQFAIVNAIQHGVFKFSPTDIVLIFYSDGLGFFSYDSLTRTFVPLASQGEVILPVNDAHFANFIGTNGAIGDLGFQASNEGNNIVATVNVQNERPEDTFVPCFIGGDGSIGLQSNGSIYNFNGNVVAGSNSAAVSGDLVSSSGVAGSIIIRSQGNEGSFDTHIFDNSSLGQSTDYFLPDPGQSNATFGIFLGNPPELTPGHMIVAASPAGILVDGGPPPTLDGVVLLNPTDDQTIVNGQLILQPGSLIIGQSNVNDGLLQLLNDSGLSSFSIYSSLSGDSTNNNVSITTADTLGQSTTYTMPDPGATTATFNVTATSVTSGNILVAGDTAGVLVDSGVSVTQLELVSNLIAQQTVNIGGDGVGPLTITQPSCLDSSVITVSVVSSSNPCFVQSITAANGSFDITMSDDPGASLILNYVLFVSPQ